MSARMHVGEQWKIVPCAIHVGGSIGLHKYEDSDVSIALYQVMARQFVMVKKKFYAKTHVIYAKKEASIV